MSVFSRACPTTHQPARLTKQKNGENKEIATEKAHLPQLNQQPLLSLLD